MYALRHHCLVTSIKGVDLLLTCVLHVFWFHVACFSRRASSLRVSDFPFPHDFSRAMYNVDLPLAVIAHGSWVVSVQMLKIFVKYIEIQCNCSP